MDDGLFRVLAKVAESFKGRMEMLGISVPELSQKSGISPPRIRRILRARNSSLKLETVSKLSYVLDLRMTITGEDLFRSGIRRGLEAVWKEREAEKPLSEFKERYKIKRV